MVPPSMPIQSPHDAPPGPLPFQFGLRALLGAVAVLSGLFAVIGAVGSVRSTVIVWFALLVIAHVGANAWGTKVGRKGRVNAAPRLDISADSKLPSASRPSCAGSSRLREKTRLGRTMFITTAAGAGLAGLSGTVSLSVAARGTVGWAGIFVGGVSSAVIGAFLGFLTSSFIAVSSRALREAAADLRTPPEPAPQKS